MFTIRRNVFSPNAALKLFSSQLRLLSSERFIVAIDGPAASGKIYLNGMDVSTELRTNQINRIVSLVAKFEEIRNAVLIKQQELASPVNNKSSQHDSANHSDLTETENKFGDGLVMDGRDIGTRVFPNANLKVFMTADATIRAQRRFDEMLKLKQTTSTNLAENSIFSFDSILSEINRRDYEDQTRKHSPLTKAADAVVLDTGKLSIPQVVDKMFSLVLNRMNSHHN
ncbi:Cytidylate kinase [Smittium culicis]|uniref:(d)CMP kinase n=1 Tax=Smittium culicis TaxID=133412 RepID=A0A1R1XG18_9FUNG|nr:Cytidylate kinase [Smittium culicis]